MNYFDAPIVPLCEQSRPCGMPDDSAYAPLMDKELAFHFERVRAPDSDASVEARLGNPTSVR